MQKVSIAQVQKGLKSVEERKVGRVEEYECVGLYMHVSR